MLNIATPLDCYSSLNLDDHFPFRLYIILRRSFLSRDAKVSCHKEAFGELQWIGTRRNTKAIPYTNSLHLSRFIMVRNIEKRRSFSSF